jgi:hypothetical protein
MQLAKAGKSVFTELFRPTAAPQRSLGHTGFSRVSKGVHHNASSGAFRETAPAAALGAQRRSAATFSRTPSLPCLFTSWQTFMLSQTVVDIRALHMKLRMYNWLVRRPRFADLMLKALWL